MEFCVERARRLLSGERKHAKIGIVVAPRRLIAVRTQGLRLKCKSVVEVFGFIVSVGM